MPAVFAMKMLFSTVFLNKGCNSNKQRNKIFKLTLIRQCRDCLSPILAYLIQQLKVEEGQEQQV